MQEAEQLLPKMLPFGAGARGWYMECLGERIRSKGVVNVAEPDRDMGIVVLHQPGIDKACCRGYRRRTLQDLNLVSLRAHEGCPHGISIAKANEVLQTSTPRQVLHLNPEFLARVMGPNSRDNVNDPW